MTDPLQSALARLDARTHALDQLAQEIGAQRLLFDLRGLPPLPRAPATREPDTRQALPPTLSPAQVDAAWRADGAAWLAALGRRDLSAVAAATGDPTVGARLALDPVLLPCLLPRLRTRRRFAVLTRLYFHVYPTPHHLSAALHELRAATPTEQWPAWAARFQQGNDRLVRGIGEAVVAEGWAAMAEALDLPDAASRGTWAEAVAERAHVTSVAEGERLLRYADGGREMRGPAALTPAGRHVVRKLVAYANRATAARLRIASLLRLRVADVFGIADAAAWTGLEAERKQIRRWVAAEILDVLFRHLVPNNEHAHHTEPRRAFWQRYTGRVDRLWLLIEPGMRHRLDRPDLRELLERVGDVVEIRDLEGAGEQAIVWMHLRADGGGVVTVVEGNANASCRVRFGALEPPRRRVRGGLAAVRYSQDIVRGVLSTGKADFVRAHQSGWEQHLGRELRSLGVRP